MTVWRMRIACWISRLKTPTVGICKNYAFPLQLWFHERASILRHTYIFFLASHLLSLFFDAWEQMSANACCRSIVILKKCCNIFGFIHWAQLFLNTSSQRFWIFVIVVDILTFIITLPYDSLTASSTESSVSNYCILKVMQQLLTSSFSSSRPCHLFFNNEFYQQFLRQMWPIQSTFLRNDTKTGYLDVSITAVILVRLALEVEALSSGEN